MERIFNPRSILVIGASERPDNLARNIIGNLHAFGYRGEIYALGRQPGQVHGVPIVDSFEALPDGIDLAVLLVPAPLALDLVDGCGRKGIRRVVIESGGFGEYSPEGQQLQDRVVEIARHWGMRLVGPNCISVINLEAGVCLPFPPLNPEGARLGPVSVVAQSGGVSITYLDLLSTAGVGANKVISIGNKADLDESDYLTYLLDDPGTEIVLLYLESIVAGRELMELARASTKPLIVHKANRSEASRRIALSHTAALAADDRIVSAALRQASILRADGFRDATAIAQGLVLPPVTGDELVIISRSGGHAVVAADAAERHGFRLPDLPDAFVQQARELFRADVIALTNPLDLGTIFEFNLYAQLAEECLRALAPDAVLLINTYSANEAAGGRQLAHRVGQVMRETGRPVAFCVYAQGDEARAVQAEVDFPIFGEIEEAIRGLAAARAWHRRRVPQLSETPPGGEAADLPAGVLTTDRALALCAAYGIPVAEWETAADAEEAAHAADRLGYPVALKLLAADVVHKSDVGGVALGLPDADAVRRAADEILAAAPGAAALLVQRMAGPGIEVILGGKRDASFGPVVMFGLGGVHVELFDDVAFRIAPLTRADADEMIAEVRSSRLLDGWRGAPPADRESLASALLALSRIMIDNPRLAEIDVNPLLVNEHGAAAVDARALVEE